MLIPPNRDEIADSTGLLSDRFIHYLEEIASQFNSFETSTGSLEVISDIQACGSAIHSIEKDAQDFRSDLARLTIENCMLRAEISALKKKISDLESVTY